MVAGHQDATREARLQLSTKYETYISALVFQEVGKGDPDRARLRLEAVENFPMLDMDQTLPLKCPSRTKGNSPPCTSV
jgi:hypothetical protein